MNKTFKILAINPGSTSTKISVFENDVEKFTETLSHSTSEISKFTSVADQYEYREKMIFDFLDKNDCSINSISAISGRGGLLKPMPGGTTKVNNIMISELQEAKYGEHASNLGAILANSLASKHNIPAFIVDPVVVDELKDVARIAGHPLFERKSRFHALNQKAVAREVANKLGKKYEECNFIVAHMGGGISVSAHEQGKVIDTNDALDGEGPFSPERSVNLPSGPLVKMCFSGKYSEKEIYKMIVGKGGIVAHLGTNDMRDVEKKVEEGDEKYILLCNAMAYNIAKHIGFYSVALKGKVDRIILTGGIAYDKFVTKYISDHVSFIAPLEICPGEEEMKSLALGALRVLKGEENAKEYN